MNNYGKACKLCNGWKDEHMTSNREKPANKENYENL